jgi:hypothetical protein
MKYLKRFNESIWDENFLCKEVTGLELRQAVGTTPTSDGNFELIRKGEDLTDYELEELKNLFPEFKFKIENGFSLELNPTFKFRLFGLSKFKKIRMVKIQDDYFIIVTIDKKDKQKGYICDSLDGVREFREKYVNKPIKESHSTEEYFKEISEGDFFSKQKEFFNFPQSDLNQLEEIFKNDTLIPSNKKELSIEKEKLRNVGDGYREINYVYIGEYLSGSPYVDAISKLSYFRRVIIYAYPDEYFYVNYWTDNNPGSNKMRRTTYQYFCCDQLEGVVELLRNKEMIK